MAQQGKHNVLLLLSHGRWNPRGCDNRWCRRNRVAAKGTCIRMQAKKQRVEPHYREHLGKFKERERQGITMESPLTLQRGRGQEWHGFSSCRTYGSYPRILSKAIFCFGRSGVGPEMRFWEAPRGCWCCWSRNHILGSEGLVQKAPKRLPGMLYLLFLKMWTGHPDRNWRTLRILVSRGILWSPLLLPHYLTASA